MKYPSVTVVFNWRGAVNSTGLYSVHLRFIEGISSKYYKIDTPQKITKEEWGGRDDEWIKSSHPYYFEINSKIREKKNVIYDLIKRSYSFNKPLSVGAILLHLNGGVIETPSTTICKGIFSTHLKS